MVLSLERYTDLVLEYRGKKLNIFWVTSHKGKLMKCSFYLLSMIFHYIAWLPNVHKFGEREILNCLRHLYGSIHHYIHNWVQFSWINKDCRLIGIFLFRFCLSDPFVQNEGQKDSPKNFHVNYRMYFTFHNHDFHNGSFSTNLSARVARRKLWIKWRF